MSSCSCIGILPPTTTPGGRRPAVRRRSGRRRQPSSSSSSLGSSSLGSDDAPPLRTPHSGYHRIVGFPRPFFEGWYFRVTLPEARDNVSLVYHVYDPDVPTSARRSAGAQVCAPHGKYIFRESTAVEEFYAAPHELALRMRAFGADDDDDDAYDLLAGERKADEGEEFFEVAEGGTRHRGRLLRGGEVNDPTVWPPGKCADDVAWDITVRPVVGYGGGRGSGGGGGGGGESGGKAAARGGSGARVGAAGTSSSSLNGTGKTGEGADVQQMSTAGWLSSLPVFEPHYQVTMAHGLASGWIEADGVRTAFEDCPAYSEKNWGGAGFPSKWFWVQCNSFAAMPGLSVTATGGNRGVVILPGVREEVAAVLVHTGGDTGGDGAEGGDRGGFYPFLPISGPCGQEAAEVTWEVAPWGSWRVTAKTSTREILVTATAPDDDDGTVLRAPQDDTNAGMAPLCRESFRGTAVVSMWELDPQTGRRGAAVLDAVTSDSAAVEVGGGPWYAPWTGRAEMREPLGSLAALQVDVDGLAGMLRPFVDIVPGL